MRKNRMLRLNFAENEMMRIIIQDYLHSFNHFCSDPKLSPKISDQMYNISANFKDIYDRIPSENLYAEISNDNKKCLNAVFGMPLNNDDISILNELFKAFRSKHFIDPEDNFSKKHWKNLNRQIINMYKNLN